MPEDLFERFINDLKNPIDKAKEERLRKAKEIADRIIEKYKDRIKSKQTCPKKSAKCKDKLKCPIPEEEKKKIVAKLRESGKTKVDVIGEDGKIKGQADIADAIENGKIPVYEYNEEVRMDSKDGPTVLGKEKKGEIWVTLTCDEDPCGDACMATVAAHEGRHAFDGRSGIKAEDRLEKEFAAFKKENEVWEAFKLKNPKLEDVGNDKFLECEKEGGDDALRYMIRKTYNLGYQMTYGPGIDGA